MSCDSELSVSVLRTIKIINPVKNYSLLAIHIKRGIKNDKYKTVG